jgi:hypothetical protein
MKRLTLIRACFLLAIISLLSGCIWPEYYDHHGEGDRHGEEHRDRHEDRDHHRDDNGDRR